MKPKFRLILFIAGAAGLALFYGIVAFNLPGPGALIDRYRLAINTRTVPERHTTDAVTAVNFDYRGFDTLGEEFILFASVLGALVLLREAQERREASLQDAVAPGRDIPPSDSMKVWIIGLIAPKVLFGIYVVTHGQLSPGGGFQGGVILATVPLIIYLGQDYLRYKKIVPHALVHIAEAVGAAGYAMVGFLGFLFAKPFLTNVVPLGKIGEPTSGGTIALISATVGLEVAAGFALLLYGFLQETLTPQGGNS